MIIHRNDSWADEISCQLMPSHLSLKDTHGSSQGSNPTYFLIAYFIAVFQDSG